VITFIGLAIAIAFAGIFIGSATGANVGLPFWIVSLLLLGTAGFMIYSSKRGKPALWAYTLEGLDLRGDEDALDIGCGHGLVTIEVAKRVPDGSATGIDTWHKSYKTGHGQMTAELNARCEGVEDRVEIVDGDVTDLPFDDASFDLVTASLAIHHLPLADERQAAIGEMVRVLRPGGRVVIVDNGRTSECEDLLRDAGLADVERTAPSFAIYPPARTVTARKPKTRTSRASKKRGSR
jgi:SAM-dependent methyltransferase